MAFRLGMFGSAAPRIRRVEDPYLLYQTAPPAQLPEDSASAPLPRRRATASSLLAAGDQVQPTNVPPMGMFGTGPKAPKPATPKTAIPMADRDSGYIPGKRDWMKEIGSDPLGFFLTGTDGLSDKREEAILSDYARRAEAKEAERLQAQSAMLDAAGITGRERIAYLANPEKYSENVSTNYAARNIGAGDSAYINGELTTAPKFGVDGGRGYIQTPKGTEWGDQRGKSYEEMTKEGELAETTRNNNLTNNRGWATIDIERDKAAKAGLPDFGDENSFRNQYLGQAKPFQDVKAAAGRVKTLSADMNPAEQMALVFSTMKMLDPGSTVREGEYATAQNTTGIAGQAWNYYNKMQNGEFLNPTQIQEFRDMIGGLEREAEKSYVQTLDQYRGMAPRYRMDPSIIQDFRGPGAAPTPREQAAAAAREAAARAGHAGGVMGGQGQFDPAAFAGLGNPNDVTDLLDKYR